MVPLLRFLDYVISLYEYVVIAAVIVSWLIAFGVINGYNPFVRSLHGALSALTEPLLARIRPLMPDLGAVDITPIILLLFCFFLRSVVIWGWLIPLFSGV